MMHGLTRELHRQRCSFPQRISICVTMLEKVAAAHNERDGALCHMLGCDQFYASGFI